MTYAPWQSALIKNQNTEAYKKDFQWFFRSKSILYGNRSVSVKIIPRDEFLLSFTGNNYSSMPQYAQFKNGRKEKMVVS